MTLLRSLPPALLVAYLAVGGLLLLVSDVRKRRVLTQPLATLANPASVARVPTYWSKVDHVLYAGNILDKAREVFAAAIKHRPRIRLTIRQRGQVLELPMSTREQRRLTYPTKKASSDPEEKAFSFLEYQIGRCGIPCLFRSTARFLSRWTREYLAGAAVEIAAAAKAGIVALATRARRDRSGIRLADHTENQSRANAELAQRLDRRGVRFIDRSLWRSLLRGGVVRLHAGERLFHFPEDPNRGYQIRRTIALCARLAGRRRL